MADGAQDGGLDRIAPPQGLRLDSAAPEALSVDCDGEQGSKAREEPARDVPVGVPFDKHATHVSLPRAELVRCLARLGPPDRVELDPASCDAERPGQAR